MAGISEDKFEQLLDIYRKELSNLYITKDRNKQHYWLQKASFTREKILEAFKDEKTRSNNNDGTVCSCTDCSCN
jgi:hypothetical protein